MISTDRAAKGAVRIEFGESAEEYEVEVDLPV
jgi:hypothetical protein